MSSSSPSSSTSLLRNGASRSPSRSPWRPVIVGLTIRLAISVTLPLAMDDGLLLPGVRYTDVDYDVFSDAAVLVDQDKSPYDRRTYRYTPFLALFLSWCRRKSWPFWIRHNAGRWIFCVADVLCGHIILCLRRSERTEQSLTKQQQQQKEQECSKSQGLNDGILRHVREKLRDADFVDALWWLYNPLAINICTRGSAESLMVLLPVILSISLAKSSSPNSTQSPANIVASGLLHGVAVHTKLYPIIYTPSFVTFLATRTEKPTASSKSKNVSSRIKTWILCLVGSPSVWLFGISSLFSFGALTCLAWYMYGDVALQEGLLYHFGRLDHRHNYSMHWLWIYLSKAAAASAASTTTTFVDTTAKVLFFTLPQITLLFTISFTVAPSHLPLALFLQTFIFVITNRVITAQYFTWYLCLLPLCSTSFAPTRRLGLSTLVLGLSILFWLGSAYCLEMLGWSVHLQVWIASVVFFLANVQVFGAMMNSYQIRREQQQALLRPKKL